MPGLGPSPLQGDNPSGERAKVCCRTWHMDYERMLVYLDIPSLQQRRLQIKSNMMCQFVHGGSYIPEGLLLSPPPSNCSLRNPSYFSVPHARTNVYYDSFFHKCLDFGMVCLCLLFVHPVVIYLLIREIAIFCRKKKPWQR